MMWFLLAAAIGSEVAGTLALRASDGGRRRLWLIPVLFGYGAAFLFLARTLSAGMSVGVAYGTWAASGVALTAIAGHVLFGEKLSPKMCTGIAFVIVGVVSIEIGAS